MNTERTNGMDIAAMVEGNGKEGKERPRVLIGAMPSATKDSFLRRAAALVRERTAAIQAEKPKRPRRGKKRRGLSSAMLDRLALTDTRLEGVAVYAGRSRRAAGSR